MAETLIDFLRHGEPLGGRQYRGHSVDHPLTEKGWNQMWYAVGNTCPWQQVICSPLQRCQSFARSLSEKHKLPLIIDERLREVGFGSWEGRSPEEIASENNAEYDNFHKDPVNNRPEGAEPLTDFGQRIVDAYNDILLQYPGQHILVVAHAGVIRAAVGHVMQSPPQAWYRIKVNNGSLTRFHHDKHGSKLVFHNNPTLP